MVRTFSRTAALIAASFVFSGCIIVQRDKPTQHARPPVPPPPHRTTPPVPPPPPPKPTSSATNSTTPTQPQADTKDPKFKHEIVSKLVLVPTKSSTDQLAPKITSPILFGNGEKGAFTGHAYVVPPNTEKLPDFSLLVPFATFYTDSFDIKSQEFSGGFPGALMQDEWFAIRYEGKINIEKEGKYEFKLNSDDGAILYVDGIALVNNDGHHTEKTVKATKQLRPGSHAVRLDYFQAQKGTVALQLHMIANRKETLLVGSGS